MRQKTNGAIKLEGKHNMQNDLKLHSHHISLVKRQSRILFYDLQLTSHKPVVCSLKYCHHSEGWVVMTINIIQKAKKRISIKQAAPSSRTERVKDASNMFPITICLYNPSV